MTSIRMGSLTPDEYLIEQDEQMYVTARQVAQAAGEPDGETRTLGQMDDINSTDGRQQAYDALYGDSTLGASSL